jgi:hypothetical protein
LRLPALCSAAKPASTIWRSQRPSEPCSASWKQSSLLTQRGNSAPRA